VSTNTQLSTRANYYWRLVVTGLAFTTFGLGGLIIGILWFPLLVLMPLSKRRRQKIARFTIGRGFRLFMWLFGVLGIFNLTYLEKKHFRLKGAIFIANHPTLLDIVALLSVIPSGNCVIKPGLKANIFTWAAVTAAGYVVNRDGDQFLRDCEAALDQGDSLVIFPEGTRSTRNQLKKFNRGAAHLACRRETPIVPVVITCNPPTLHREVSWFDIPERKFTLEVKAYPPRKIVKRASPRSTAAREVTAEWEAFFNHELDFTTEKPEGIVSA